MRFKQAGVSCQTGAKISGKFHEMLKLLQRQLPSFTALMPQHHFTSEMNSPSHLQTANTMWCIQLSLPCPGRNVTNHCLRPLQLLALKPHQSQDPRYQKGWNTQATNRNCDQPVDTGTLVLARHNTKSTIST